MRNDAVRTKIDRDRAPAQAASTGPEAISSLHPGYGIDLLDRPNRTRLPDRLKSGVESLSGVSLDDVRVHYDSPRPANLRALAYTQGTDIFVGLGQEKHLPHEAWHVTQQKQGRVRATVQAKGIAVSEDSHLEHEAEHMGRRAAGLAIDVVRGTSDSHAHNATKAGESLSPVVQRVDKKVSPKAARRLGYAKDAIKFTKTAIPKAGNQIPALRDGNVNPYFRLKVMREEKPDPKYGRVYPDPPYWEFTSDESRKLAGDNPADYTTAKANLAHGGNCGEHASVAYSYLRTHAVGETIAKCSKPGLDHAFVLIGDLSTLIGDSDSEIAVADPWPLRALATLWEDHFAYTYFHSDIKQRYSMVADGRDVEPLIRAGLRLTAAGQQIVGETLPATDTEDFLKTKGHLWNHPNAAAAGKDFDYKDGKGGAVG